MASVAPILQEIIASRRVFAERLRDEADDLEEKLAGARPVRNFGGALDTRGVALIAECKARSPSAGVLADPYDPVALARRYEQAGAAAISVLTEPEYFGGTFEHLRAVRDAVGVPILCKDFVIDELQLAWARANGADAVLLIVSILDDAELRRLHDAAHAIGLQPLVEVHTEGEVERVLALGADLIGINNRDLTTMRTDPQTAQRLRPMIPDGPVVISESGIRSRDDMEALARLRIDAALVGESLLRAPDLEGQLHELLGR